MTRREVILISVLTLGAVLVSFATACGSSPAPNRILNSIAVTPTAADAQNFPSGQVQFVATGSFTMPPSPAPVPFTAPYSGSWLSSSPNMATINPSGLAQCLPGTAGTVTITAIASSNSAPGGAMSTAVSGTAALTCP